MHNNELLFRRTGHVLVGAAPAPGLRASVAQLATLSQELEQLGHRPGPRLMQAWSQLSPTAFAQEAKALLALVKKRLGDHVRWRPLYPGFPDQVMRAEMAELYWNAFWHYVSEGQLREIPEPQDSPAKPAKPRGELAGYERFASLRLIELGEPRAFERLFTQLAGAASSLSAQDRQDLQTLVSGLGLRVYELMPQAFVSRENLAVLTAALLRMSWAPADVFAREHLHTATDALRLAAAWCQGDVSLAAPTRFVALPRRLRRLLMALIDASPARSEDMQRHAERFKRLGQVLHAGEFSRQHPQAAQAFARIHAGQRVPGFNSRLEAQLAQIRDAQDHDTQTQTLAETLTHLQTRPGELARRLDVLLRRAEGSGADAVLAAFEQVAQGVSVAVLLQVHRHFQTRLHLATSDESAKVAERDERPLRAFFPKGSIAKVFARPDTREPIAAPLCQQVVQICEAALLQHFAQRPALGRCWVDWQLARYNVPMAQRAASKALRTLTRGSRLPVPPTHTLRLFLWWKNAGEQCTDIDLSAGLFNAQYQYMETLAYYHLKTHGAVHSGDLVDGGDGAAEFIDLDMDVLRARGVRWVVMAVQSYTQQAFCDLPECFAGWMARRAPKSGEIFQPRTVQDRIDLVAHTTIALPLVFDLHTMEVIWADVALTQAPRWNNLHNNLRGVGLMLRALTQHHWPDLHTLFTLHARARGQLVKKSSQAETVFAPNGDITPFDLDRIRAEFL